MRFGARENAGRGILLAATTKHLGSIGTSLGHLFISSAALINQEFMVLVEKKGMAPESWKRCGDEFLILSPAKTQNSGNQILPICGLGERVGCECGKRAFNPQRLKSQIGSIWFPEFVCLFACGKLEFMLYVVVSSISLHLFNQVSCQM